jgi:hypothetical protein
MEFIISNNEIIRRKRAFSALMVSLFIGLFLASFFLNYPISGRGYLLIAVIIILISILTFWFLTSILKIKLLINNECIERINGKNIQRLALSEIKEVKIKRRTNGIIREIYIWSRDKRSMFLTAFEESFEEIKNILENKITTDVVVKETKEPINFDHPLFYPFLGILISFLGIGFLNVLTKIDYLMIKIIFTCFSVFILALSLYFIFKKPISARHGGKSEIADYIIGIIMFCASIFIFFVSLSY